MHTVTSDPAAHSVARSAPRFASIDIVRGLVMVLMALDHVRVFSAVPAWSGDPAVFFTRWITNFCAPAFVFLAGTGAFLHADRLGDRRVMMRYLLVRGALLVFLEMTISRLSWTFNLDYYNYTEANVLWVIGWSMIVLAGLQRLPIGVIAAFGIVIIAGHNLVDYLGEPTWLPGSPLEGWWRVLYFGGEFRFFGTGPKLVVLYSIIPWAGVMAAGYAFGAIMRLDSAERRRRCFQLGGCAIALFLVLRVTNLYGNPWPFSAADENGAVLSFLATNKYPASLQFLLMTLGPVILALPWLEHREGAPWRVLATFGRVPLFYYLLHLPLIHTLAVLISLVRTPDATGWLFLNHPLRIPPAPDGYLWSLPLLYSVTVLAVVILYFPCRWYDGFKRRQQGHWFTRYI